MAFLRFNVPHLVFGPKSLKKTFRQDKILTMIKKAASITYYYCYHIKVTPGTRSITHIEQVYIDRSMQDKLFLSFTL